MEQGTPITPPPAAGVAEDKTVAILAYITLIGFIIAIVLHGQKKTALGAFHLRQMVGIILMGACNFVLIFIPILGWIAMFALGICALIMWVMGLIGAINGEMKPAPILGAKFQEWFKNAFN
ncbi:MAG: hypothetical protein IPO90_03120 [Flavobacteriales bacterium]|nr:hypothetical protein [Flavobacteriales bacterium]MBL0043329.1 hypothetical protein [Flavobacteriales bacterium]